MSEDKPTFVSEDPFKPYKGRFEDYPEIPAKGRDKDSIFDELETMSIEENESWKNGKCSGTYYHAGKDHLEFLNKVFCLFSHVNAIQVDTCPSIFKLEADIIAMTGKMLNGDAVTSVNPEDGVVGTVTSGGSESIIMAMKVYRDWALAEKGITAPEIIKPSSAHPAFIKAAKYYGMKVIEIPVTEPDFRLDTQKVKAAVNENTVALIGSAGNYPWGLIDPIEALSEIALENKIGLHVDGCLGGFILPWVEKLGYTIPKFDFRVPGVTSISCDTHKFGYGLKGTSVVLYRRNALRRYQYFEAVDFQGGTYISPSASGSRSGGLTAATWASLVYLGEEGYLKAAREIMNVAVGIRKAVDEIPELNVIGDPTFVISFYSDVVNVFHVNDFMKKRGWRFNSCQNPHGLHFCVTMPQTRVEGIAESFKKDLLDAVEYAKAAEGEPESAALYGMDLTPDGKKELTELIYGAFDHFYSV